MSGYDRENRNVLRRCLKTARVGSAVSGGRGLHFVRALYKLVTNIQDTQTNYSVFKRNCANNGFL